MADAVSGDGSSAAGGSAASDEPASAGAAWADGLASAVLQLWGDSPWQENAMGE